MNKSKGFNLIEVLIALVVISISLFAVARVQIAGMQGMETAKESTSSAVNITNLMERFSKQRDAIRLYLSAHSDGFSKHGLASMDMGCTSMPTSITNADQADQALSCEVEAWASSMVAALNLETSDDLAFSVLVIDRQNYEYTTNIRYSIPRITVAVMWKKNPGADMTIADYKLKDDGSGLMYPPAADSELGYMSMEYVAP